MLQALRTLLGCRKRTVWQTIFVVGFAQDLLDLLLVAKRRDDPCLEHELELFEHVAPGRITRGNHQHLVAQQQGHDAQADCRRKRNRAQGLSLDRELRHIDDRVTHLAGQRSIEITPRQKTHVYQQLPQGDRALGLLALECLRQLTLVDKPEPGQGFANPDHRHPGLLIQSQHQLIRGDNRLVDQTVTQFALAQTGLLGCRLLHLLTCHRTLRYQQMPDMLTKINALVGLARHEDALDATFATIHRCKKEEAEAGFDITYRLARPVTAVLQLQLIVQRRAMTEDVGKIGVTDFF